ncbi:hypothetical protein RIVM261_036310 [Rivularia sp. IAM M-261]|nr:hypothetical protein CAL7716_075240 [Calothrix sp. PCC 7716]GJD18675.1 hypothetical protein RIVM261_036310 [Rivularia sp. IAM M-261]
MNKDEFAIFFEESIDNLQRKQEDLKDKYAFGSFPKYCFDQEIGTLQFQDDQDQVQVEALVTPIGSFSYKSETWQWSWANSSILERLRVKSERIKELYTFTGAPIFEASIVKVNEEQAWELSAMAVEYLKSLGCYSMPYEGRQLRNFVSIDEIIKCPKDLRLN